MLIYLIMHLKCCIVKYLNYEEYLPMLSVTVIMFNDMVESVMLLNEDA